MYQPTTFPSFPVSNFPAGFPRRDYFQFPSNYPHLPSFPLIEYGVAIRVNGRVVFFRPIHRNHFRTFAPDVVVGASTSDGEENDAQTPEQQPLDFRYCYPGLGCVEGNCQMKVSQNAHPPRNLSTNGEPLTFQFCHPSHGCVEGKCDMRFQKNTAA